MHKALLTLDEAAEMLSLSPRTLSRLLQRGEIPAVRIGRLVRVRTCDVHTWVDRQAEGWFDAPPQPRPARESSSTPGPAVLSPS